jgi:hypothetical protein
MEPLIMQPYTEFVEMMAKAGEDKVFFNSGPNHAAVVMSRIFKYSNDTVRIFNGGFSGVVSNDEEYLCHLDSFLERGKIRILVENDNSNKDSQVYKILKRHKDNVEIYRSAYRLVTGEGNRPVHFTIGDQKLLRLETGVDDYTASVNFGKDAGVYITLFEQLLSDSKDRAIKL